MAQSADLDNLCINTIRFLAVDAVQKANSGHPGMPMGAAAMAFSLWTRFMKYNPTNPAWFDRDRFVLSAGHGSMLLYSMLYLTGYDLPMEQIQQFRQWGSMTPGHPERGCAPGVEVTTGPLGQGFGDGVGMAIAEAHLAARYNKPGFEIIKHFTYAIASDGDLMEGVASEAASLAGDLKLGKLIYLYDDNKITLSAGTDLTFREDVPKRFDAYGWHTVLVDDGNDVAAIDAAIRTAQAETTRPSLISVRTHIGYGSPHKQDCFEAHGSPLGEEEVKLTKEHLGWPVEPPFYVPEEALKRFREATDRGRDAEAGWSQLFDAYADAYPAEAAELSRLMRGELPQGWDKDIPTFPADPKGIATRVASGKVLNAIAAKAPELIGGSADLNPSTHTDLKGMGDFQSPLTAEGDIQGVSGGGWSYEGRNIAYGVREHAMGAISNGIAAHGGLIPFASTFLIFSDYMRPSIRLASLMDLQVIYVFTHDSVCVGEDGPTHEPIEQLASLRAIPQLIVIRPGDANETAVAWHVAIQTRDRPVALALSRQNVPTLDRSQHPEPVEGARDQSQHPEPVEGCAGQYASAEGLRHGAYILIDPPEGDPQIILIATGSEVDLALSAREKLLEGKIRARVVSMPSWELFDAQPKAYRDKVLPPSIRARLAIEAASSMGWCRYVGDGGDVIGIDHFGASAPAKTLLSEFGFTVENVYKRARALLED